MKQLLILLVLLAVVEAPAGPRDWQVDFEVRALDRVLVPRGAAQARPSWYCAYRLTNRSGSDRDLALRLFVETDVSRGVPGRRKAERHSDAVDPAVQRVVEGNLGTDPRQPLLDAIRMQGRIRDGEQKDGIAVFGEVSAEADIVDLYVVGLSAAVHKSRLGEDYQKMIRAGTSVHVVQRDPTGEYSFLPLARRVSALEFKDLQIAGKPTTRMVTEAQGEILCILDHPILTDVEQKRFLERTVLHLRYRRSGDERRPQLDVYRADGQETFLAIEAIPANP